MNLNSPATARLTPADRPMPAELTATRVELTRGLPQRLGIEPAGLRVVLSVSTGLVRPLLNLPPDTVVLTSGQQRAPAGAPGTVSEALAESRERAAPRLLFISGGRFTAACPLVTGARVLVPGAGGHASAAVEVWVASFALTVSALVGRGATGSWIDFGWRPLARGADAFDSAVLRPSLRRHLAYSRRRDAHKEVVVVSADLLSPDAATTASAGGLNWRLLHDRL
jgi:hypothetical protein